MLIRSPDHLASFIASHRKQQKLSQATVGDLVSLKQATISQFENKPDNTRLDTLFRILAALNLDLEINPKESKPETDIEW